MNALSELTQTHLCLVILDKTTHEPIARMPIYAEVSVLLERLPYQVGSDEWGTTRLSGFLADPTFGPPLKSSIIRSVDEATFRSLTDDDKAQFLLAIFQLLTKRINQVNLVPLDRVSSTVAGIVTLAVQERALPVSSQIGQKYGYSYPLGFVATDHAGYQLLRPGAGVEDPSHDGDRRF